MYTEEPYSPTPETEDPEMIAAQKRLRKIKSFYKNLASWAGTSVMLLGMNLFISGDISWAKFPVFFWGIFLAADFFKILYLQRTQKEWEERQAMRMPGRPGTASGEGTEDYSGELLHRKEREVENLADYRKVSKPWKDQDLV
jgi:hypothetical protein